MTYSADIAARICDRIAEGESLRQVCRDEGIPHSTVLTWARENIEFANRYARAREDGNDAEFEDLTAHSDAEPERDEKGKIDPAWVQLQRLRIDTRKWALSKKAPKKYGDKLELAGDQNSPLTIIVKKLTDA